MKQAAVYIMAGRRNATLHTGGTIFGLLRYARNDD
jgi:hypothetical protein